MSGIVCIGTGRIGKIHAENIACCFPGAKIWPPRDAAVRRLEA
jgi:hypothetical protein